MYQHGISTGMAGHLAQQAGQRTWQVKTCKRELMAVIDRDQVFQCR